MATQKNIENKKPVRMAVILAGGLGTRLQPLTNIIPKPLLPIGESTVLEIQIMRMKQYGVEEVYIATNYMSDYVSSIVSGSAKYGIKVVVSREDKPLGTCGPLGLLRDKLTEPFFMMNGDILTNIDFGKLGAFALEREPDLTVVTKEINIPFRFGKVFADGDYLVGVEEKPTYKHEILAGIYVLKPTILSAIPDGIYYGVDQLIRDRLNSGKGVLKYLTHDYWVDIGQLEDYEMAKQTIPAELAASR